jgi:hypothetical protein
LCICSHHIAAQMCAASNAARRQGEANVHKRSWNGDGKETNGHSGACTARPTNTMLAQRTPYNGGPTPGYLRHCPWQDWPAAHGGRVADSASSVIPRSFAPRSWGRFNRQWRWAQQCGAQPGPAELFLLAGTRAGYGRRRVQVAVLARPYGNSARGYRVRDPAPEQPSPHLAALASDNKSIRQIRCSRRTPSDHASASCGHCSRACISGLHSWPCDRYPLTQSAPRWCGAASALCTTVLAAAMASDLTSGRQQHWPLRKRGILTPLLTTTIQP